MNLIVIEEPILSNNFKPFTYTRATFELVVGNTTLLSKIKRILNPKNVYLLTPPYLKKIVSKRNPTCIVNPREVENDSLFVNPLIDINEISEIKKNWSNNAEFVIYGENTFLAAKLNTKKSNAVLQSENPCNFNFRKLHPPKKESNMLYARWPWDLINLNSRMLVYDSQFFKGKPLHKSLKDVRISGKSSNIFIGEDVIIEPFTFFDATNGPIMISDRCKIQSFSRIEGPCFIGKDSLIRSANIGGSTSIGDFNKIGGEVCDSILMNYSNKAHTGYLGHSYVGEWVNIGAGACNSDLKNTYGAVRVGDKKKSTGEIKIGCFLADGVKVSIGTQIYAGKTIGAFSQVSGLINDDIPSFLIYSGFSPKIKKELYIKSIIATQSRMMRRRKIKQSIIDRQLINEVFRISSSERNSNI